MVKDIPKFEHVAVNKAGNDFENPDTRKNLWSQFKRPLNVSMGYKLYRNKLVPPFPVSTDLVPNYLRVIYCTDLAEKVVDIRTAQRLMRHADIRMTANIYTKQ